MFKSKAIEIDPYVPGDIKHEEYQLDDDLVDQINADEKDPDPQEADTTLETLQKEITTNLDLTEMNTKVAQMTGQTKETVTNELPTDLDSIDKNELLAMLIKQASQINEITNERDRFQTRGGLPPFVEDEFSWVQDPDGWVLRVTPVALAEANAVCKVAFQKLIDAGEQDSEINLLADDLVEAVDKMSNVFTNGNEFKNFTTVQFIQREATSAIARYVRSVRQYTLGADREKKLGYTTPSTYMVNLTDRVRTDKRLAMILALTLKELTKEIESLPRVVTLQDALKNSYDWDGLRHTERYAEHAPGDVVKRIAMAATSTSQTQAAAYIDPLEL